VAPITEIARRNAARCAEAQTRAHAAASLGTAQAENWARREAAGTTLEWRQFLAGGLTSVMGVYALIAGAADRRTTREDAENLDSVYWCLCALATMLDSLVDYEGDARAGKLPLGYLQYYRDRECLGRDLARTVYQAATRARTISHTAYHLITLVGIVAYYTSSPEASGEFARPLVEQLHSELRPLIGPTLAVMRIWRLAKRTRAWRHGKPNLWT
jgi:hypothetical protein